MAHSTPLTRDETAANPWHGRAPAAGGVRGSAEPEQRLRSLSDLLRGIGALVLIATASTFLFQNWVEGDDLQRYLSLLAQTMLLALAGFACGLGLRESKGARTFLGLVAASAPVHCALLGALLFSRFPIGPPPGSYPAFATWVAPSGPAALGVAGGALLLLGPAVWISFLTLARRRARLLFTTFAAANGLLLIPCRDPNVMAVFITALSLGLGIVELRVLRHESVLKTREGIFARAVLGVPLLFLVARTISFYDPTPYFVGSLFASAALLLFAAAREFGSTHRLTPWLERLSALSGAAAWASFSFGLWSDLSLPDAAFLVLLTLPYAGMLVALSFLASGSRVGYRRAAAWIALGGVALDLVWMPSVALALLCMVTALAVVCYAWAWEQKTTFIVGLLGVLLGLSYQLSYAIDAYALGRWGSLALLGTLMILAASLLDRNHRRIAAALTDFRHRLGDWGY